MLEKPSTLGRFGTQHVAIVAQFTILSCGTHQKESYFQESNISDANWLRYFAFIYLVECMTSSQLKWFRLDSCKFDHSGTLKVSFQIACSCSILLSFYITEYDYIYSTNVLVVK